MTGAAAAFDATMRPSTSDERFVLHGVPWHVYVSLRDSLDDTGSRLRLTYFHGELELMSPSSDHEEAKSLLGHLLEAWCIDRSIELFAQGSTTLREEQLARGLEADESYSVGTKKRIPDLAIEVVFSAFRVDKLSTYHGLGVPEVWTFRDGRITVHVRTDDGYEQSLASGLFPALDLDLLARHIVPGTSLTTAVRAFRASLASDPH